MTKNSLLRLVITAVLGAFICAHSSYAEETRVVPRTQSEITLSFAPIVKRASPAVVNIFTKRKVAVRQNISPLMSDPLFQQFFGNQLQLQGQPQERIVSSLGSGVIIGADGTIVTSNHVVKDADQVTVALSDRREFEATITKADAQTDLAFLKIQTKDKLPYLEMRDSDTLETGDIVLAIGNPFGVGQTVTQGIISALARSAAGASDYQFFIQTDAAINPGNSGGALIDINGQLIGINTAIYSTTGASNGIGFAIPSNMVKSVFSSEVQGGRVVRAWLGINAQPVTLDIAESLGMNTPKGVIVRSVQKNSPAAKAGIQVGDIIFSANGNEVNSERELQYRVGTAAPGSTIQLTLQRKGEEKNISATLEHAPEAKLETLVLKGKHPLQGITVVTLNDDMLQQLVPGQDTSGIPKQGVLVLAAPQGSLVGGALAKGDIILQVNGKQATSAPQLEKLLSGGKSNWQIVYQRGGSVLTLSIRL